jgi:UDP-glucose 4-epimerase
LAAACAKLGKVRVLDDLSSGHRAHLAGVTCEFHHGSILDNTALEHAMSGTDVVFHLAALVSIPASFEEPAYCHTLNAHGTLRVLEAAEAAGVSRLVFASSASLYGDGGAEPRTEAMLPDPRSPYAKSKLEGEQHCDRFDRKGSLSTACGRFFNVFGPRQPAGGYAAVIPRFVELARSGKPLTVFGDGGQTRDFIFIDDVVSALLRLAIDRECKGTFNVGCGKGIEVGHLAEEIVGLCGSPSSVRHGPERRDETRHSVACIERLVAAGWRPRVTLRGGLQHTIAGRSRVADVLTL